MIFSEKVFNRIVRFGVIISISLFLMNFIINSQANAETKKFKSSKVQEVDFDEMSIKGQVRSPEGAYLVQKRGMKFLPIYEVKKEMDTKIRQTTIGME